MDEHVRGVARTVRNRCAVGDRARRVLAVLGVLAVVSTACLAPNEWDPTGRAPIGNLEIVTDAAGGIRVRGWALDPESSASIPVKVGVGGVVHTTTADLERADVARAYPGKGSRHGFDHTFGPLSTGLHGICVWVENTVGGGEDRLLGCDNIVVSDGSPRGNLETATAAAPLTVTASGWVYDPNTPDPVDVVVTIDGELAARTTADGRRPDVGASHGRPNSGFHTEVTTLPGSHQVCVAAFNVGFGAPRLLGCRDVVVADTESDHRPTGHLVEVTPTGADSVRVEGVASDPDGVAGLQVRLTVDPGSAGETSVLLDVAGGTFATELSGLSEGLHSLCPTGLDIDGGVGVRGERDFVCGSVVLGEVAVGTGGAAGDASWVAPPPGHELRTTSRDAGVSVALRDGSTMWFFGDTLQKDTAGDLEYFVNNSAAWASAGAPTVTLDAVDPSGAAPAPYQFVDAPDFCSGGEYPNPALWPESAVAVPQADGTDRILVFMSKVCLGDEFLEIEGLGMALVELTYDPGDPPDEERIVGTVTELELFGAEHPYGRAAVLGGDGSTIHTYECGRFDPDDQAAWDSCTVGRVAFAQRADPSAWRFYAGGDPEADSSWVADADSAAPIESPTGSEVTAPVAAFNIKADPSHGAYVMVYSPWPGFTDRVEVRVATTPVGPFTDPVTVVLPGCEETTGGVTYLCYAGTAQPALSESGLLGIGYYDQLVTTSPLRGQYMTVTVPFSVVLTGAP